MIIGNLTVSRSQCVISFQFTHLKPDQNQDQLNITNHKEKLFQIQRKVLYCNVLQY